MSRTLGLLSLAAFLAPAAIGEKSNQLERFELFNACRPMLLVIERLPKGAGAIGLSGEALQVAAESRLRAARLYTEDRGKADLAYLYVNVAVGETAFSISVEYKKFVTDAFGGSTNATTWDSGGIGTHGSDASYILSLL